MHIHKNDLNAPQTLFLTKQSTPWNGTGRTKNEKRAGNFEESKPHKEQRQWKQAQQATINKMIINLY
jgi:hypothetical protein